MLEKIKQNKGFTLIEVLVVVIILVIFSLMLSQGIKVSVSVFNLNKVKTQAVLIANEELEKIKAMPFSEIGLIDGYPQGILSSQKYTREGFLVEYDVFFADEENKIKQVSVSVFKNPMIDKLEVTTEIMPTSFIK